MFGADTYGRMCRSRPRRCRRDSDSRRLDDLWCSDLECPTLEMSSQCQVSKAFGPKHALRLQYWTVTSRGPNREPHRSHHQMNDGIGPALSVSDGVEQVRSDRPRLAPDTECKRASLRRISSSIVRGSHISLRSQIALRWLALRQWKWCNCPITLSLL